MCETTLVDPELSKFIPFFELTEDKVLSWIKSSIGTQTINDLQEEIKRNILEISKPKFIEMELPWISNEEDKIITFKDKKKRVV